MTFSFIKSNKNQKNLNEYLKPKLSQSNNEQFLEENKNNIEDLPFKIIGNLDKKSEFFGIYHYRYLELTIKLNLLKRYSNIKTYPDQPLEIIYLSSITSIKKIKLDSKYYYFEINFKLKNNTKIKSEYYRSKHLVSRNEWYNKIKEIWDYINKKKEYLPKINNNKIIFIDDQVGIIQEINKGENRNKKENISINDFHIISKIGNGGFGTVYKVIYKKDNKEYALKVMNKNVIIENKYFKYMITEFEILKLLNGFPFILNLHFCFQSANYLFMILDFCSNGDISELKYVNNPKLLIAEIILAIEYMHKNNVLYRDLKPENILLDSEGHIKICDFNLAKSNINNNSYAYSFCGSPLYLSPEMVCKKGITFKSDIYQMGLIMYEIFTFQTAFKIDKLEILYDDIIHNRINFHIPGISFEIKNLLQRILERKPQNRLSIKEIKEHPYFDDINWDDVYNKKLGKIEIIKRKNKKKLIMDYEQERNNLHQIEEEIEKNENLNVLNGKITWKEMKKDVKREMRNFVKQFYYERKDEKSIEINKTKKKI